MTGAAALQSALDLTRGSLDAASTRSLLVGLLYLRRTQPTAWKALRTSPTTDLADFFNQVGDPELQGIANFLQGSPMPSPHSLLPLIETIDHVGSSELTAVFDDIIEMSVGLEGRKGGELYTPRSVAQVLTSVLAMGSASSVYDPACRFGELLVAAASAGKATGNDRVEAYGIALNTEARNIARINLTVNQIRNHIILNDADKKFDLFGEIDTPEFPGQFSRVITNPPFGLRNLRRPPSATRYVHPTKGRPDYVWLAESIQLLEPGGRAAIVMPNGTLFSSNPHDIRTRQSLLEDGCVEAIITLPSKLFYSTAIPVCVWLCRPPDLTQERILLIDASSAGQMVSRNRQEIAPAKIAEVAKIISLWRADREVEPRNGMAAVPLSAIQEEEYNLSPSVYLEQNVSTAEPAATSQTVTSIMDRITALHALAEEADSLVAEEIRGLEW